MTPESNNTMNWTAADIAAAEKTLAKIAPASLLLPKSPLHILFSLTDEEIVILDGLQHPQLVATPWLDESDPKQSELIYQVAMRGLIARGLVTPVGVDDSDLMQAFVDDSIRGPLVLRRTGEKIIAFTLTSSLGTQSIYGYCHTPHENSDHVVVLTESITDGGIHEFSISDVDDFIEQLVTASDAEKRAHVDSDPVIYTQDEFVNHGAGPDELAGTRLVSVIAVATPSSDIEPQGLTFYADQETLRMLNSDGVKVTVREVTKESAARAIADLIR